MKKSLMLIASIVVLSLVAACGGGGEEPAGAPEESAAPAAAPMEPGAVGTINGKVSFEGAPPEQETIQMGADPNCARLHSTPVTTEFVVVGDDGGLANVFVYVKSGLEGQTFPVPSEPVLLDQNGCQYKPHVVGIRAGQPLEIRNDDDTLHNIHAMPKNNKEFNIGQPVKGLSTERTFENPEVMVPFKCDVHKWMNSYAGVVDHPFFAVTSTDGSFSLDDVPAGNYVVEAWHERYGTKEMNVTVTADGTAEANFAFSAE
jgi:plastocyanin